MSEGRLRLGHLLVIIVEGWHARQQLVENDADEVPVDCLAMAFLLYHLRRQVRIRAAEGVSPACRALDLLPRQAEVHQHGVAFRVEHDVIWLQVSKNDIIGVQSLHRADNFADVLLGLGFAETAFDLKVLTEIAAGTEFHGHE